MPAWGAKGKRLAGNLLLSVVSILVALFALDLASYFLLRAGHVGGEHSAIMERFPAQLRMSGAELWAEFTDIDHDLRSRVAGWSRFDFDPAMGFRYFNYLTWCGPDGAARRAPEYFAAHGGQSSETLTGFLQTLKEAVARSETSGAPTRLLVAFGGSTTAHNSFGVNWPAHLPTLLRAAGGDGDLFVLNAGQNGFSTFNEKLLFSSWIAPRLMAVGLRPDAIVGLDGLNDISFGVGGYVDSVRHQAPFWFDHYHGYHQQLTDDLEHIDAASSFGALIWAVFDHAFFSNRTLFNWTAQRMARPFPYLLRVLLDIRKQRRQNHLTVAEIRRSGTDLEFVPDAIHPLERLVVPEAAQARIIGGFQDNLIDFQGLARIREMPYFSYLQPIRHHLYYPGTTWASTLRRTVDDSPRTLLRTRLGGYYRLDWKPLYAGAEALYASLSERFPGRFVNLSRIFDQPEPDPYLPDGLHYTEWGSRTLAEAIIRDLLDKGVLAARASNGPSTAVDETESP